MHGLFDSLTDSSSKGIDGYKHIKKNILSRDDVEVDTFVHSWEKQKQDEILELYHPKAFVFEEQVDFSKLIEERNLHKLSNCPRPIGNVISHLYSVTETIKLAYQQNCEYDIVIKARFDLGRINRNTSGPGRHNPYPVQCINFKTEIESNKLYTANWQHFHMGPADMWFYGDSETMKNFTNLFDFVNKNLYLYGDFHKFATSIEGNPGDLSNAIALYKYWMLNNGLWENRINLETTWE
jgi:hypothetical protein